MKTQQRHYIEAINNFIGLIPDQYFRNPKERDEHLVDPDKIRLMGGDHYVNLELPIWGCKITMFINFERQGDWIVCRGVTLGWSSTQRGISSAHATLCFYQDVLKVAAMIDAYVDSAEVVPDEDKENDLEEENLDILRRTERIEIEYDDGTELHYDSIDDARQVSEENLKVIRVYDSEDNCMSNIDADWFFDFDIKKIS